MPTNAYTVHCTAVSLQASKRAASHPLHPLNNGPEPPKWSLMEALVGEGTHSHSTFSSCNTTATNGSKKMPLLSVEGIATA